MTSNNCIKSFAALTGTLRRDAARALYASRYVYGTYMRVSSGKVNSSRIPALAGGLATLVLCFSAFDSSESEEIRLVAAEAESVDWRNPYLHDRSTDEYRDLVWSQIRTDPPEIRDHHDPDVDGDWAYRLYLHYWRCVRAAEPESADQSLKVWAERAEGARGRELDGILDSSERTADLAELCMAIPPNTDRILEAFTWIGEAARLNHEVAQIDYYRVANSYLDHPFSGDKTLLQSHPEVIVEFKETARYSLEGALERGHPESYLAMSQALSDGIVFDKDPLGAFAYAHAAELVAYESREFLNKIRRQKYILTPLLTTRELDDAKHLAHELVAVD